MAASVIELRSYREISRLHANMPTSSQTANPVGSSQTNVSNTVILTYFITAL